MKPVFIIWFIAINSLIYSQTLLPEIEFGMSTSEANKVLRNNQEKYTITIGATEFNKPRAYDRDSVKFVVFESKLKLINSVPLQEAKNINNSIKEYFVGKGYNVEKEYEINESVSAFLGGTNGTSLILSKEQVLIIITYIGIGQNITNTANNYNFQLSVTSRKIDDEYFIKKFKVPKPGAENKNNNVL